MTGKINPDELLTPRGAAEYRGVTRQNMDYLLRNGKIPSIVIDGRRFVRVKDLDAYQPDPGGRPPKAEKPKPTSKKGSKK